jgi:phosphatidylglycerophosphate synthase
VIVSLRFKLVNGLSVSRVCIAGIFLYLYLDSDADLRRLSFIILAGSVATDILDGVLARSWGVTSKLGYVLDGVGDRASYIAVFFAISYRDGFPIVLSYAFIVRDVLLYAARSVYSEWWRQAEAQRLLSKSYALVIRIVMLVYLAHSAAVLFGKGWDPRAWKAAQPWITIISIVLIGLSYASLALLVRDYIRSDAASNTDIDH